MVALQIRDVPESTRAELAALARSRGMSLQSLLLTMVEREAAAARRRSMVLDWAAAPLGGGGIAVAMDDLHAARADRDRVLVERIGHSEQ